MFQFRAQQTTYILWTKSGLLSTFINKVLLEKQSCEYLQCDVNGCFHAMIAELRQLP